MVFYGNQQLQKLGLTVNDIFKDTELLTKEYVSKNASGEISLKEQEENGHGKVHVSMVKELDIKDSLNNNIVLKSTNTDWIGEKIYNI